MKPIIKLSKYNIENSLTKENLENLDAIFQLDNSFSDDYTGKALIVLTKLLSKFKELDLKNNAKNLFSLLKQSIEKNAQTLLIENKITKEELLYCAYKDFELRQLLLQLKLVSPNDYLNENVLKIGSIYNDYLNTPLFFTYRYHSQKELEELISLGADFTLKALDFDPHRVINNVNFSGCTLFDIAIKTKHRNLIKSLVAILPKEELSKIEQELLINLKEEKDIKKQHKLLLKAINENNQTVLNEIMNNQTQYENLLLYKKKSIDKDLLQYALEFNQPIYAKALMDLNIYKKHFNSKFCYTYFSLEKNQSKGALLAYENGYFNEKVFKSYLNQISGYLGNNLCLNLFAQNLLEKGEKIDLEVLMHRGYYHILEHYIDRYKDEISKFFQKNNDTTKLGTLSTQHIQKVSAYDYHIEITQNKIKFIYHLIKHLHQMENETNNQLNANQYLNEFLESINQNEDEKWIMTCLKIGINILPQKESVIVDSIKNDKLKIKFEKNLFENNFALEEELIIVPKKKFKL
jgi:hypothetical protein